MALNPLGHVIDAELTAADNYGGASLTLARQGGANAQDLLAFDGVNVTTSGASVMVGGIQIGTYSFSAGQMAVSFGANATQARVDTLLQNIVYSNSSDAPPASVQIAWTFSDGNTGAQGAGGALSVTGITTVNITATNDPPAFTSSAVIAATEDSAYTYSITTSDVDGVDTLTITAPTLPAWLTLNDNGNGTATLTGTPTNAEVGTHSVVLQVSDGTVSVTQSFTITVANSNDAPTFTSTAVTAATEDSAYSYSITTSDVDAGDVRTITAPTLPAWLTLTDNGDGTATLTGTPTNAEVGSHSIVLAVSDGTVTTTQSFTLIVANTNDTPTLANAIANQSATEDAAFSFQFAANTFAEVDAGDTLTYTASGLPGWLSFDAATRTFSGTSTNADVGTVTVTVRATDGSGAFVEDTFDITVANTNDPPTLANAIANQSATEDAAFSFQFAANTFADVDIGDSLTYTASGLPGWLSFDAATRTFAGTPANADVGTVTITVRATDGSGAFVEEQFDITVANTNDAPVFTSSAVTAGTEDAAYSYAITTSDVDAGDTLTITAPTLPAWLTLTDNGNGTATLTGTPTNAEVGTHSVLLQLSDGTVSVTQSFTITVANSNDTPTVANPIADQSATEDAAFSFQFAANAFADVDAGDSLTYSASGLPAWLSFDASTRTFTGTPTNADVGTVTITVRATDGSSAWVEDMFEIVVANANDTPTIANPIADQSATEDAAFSFQFAANTFADVDAGDAPTYSASGLPAWLSFNAATRTFTGTPANADVGTVTITVRATDGSGAFVEEQFDITVANTNDAPTVTNPVADGTTGTDTSFSFQFAADTFSDVDAGDTLTYGASGLPTWLSFDAATRTFTGTPTYADVGTYSITITASDAMGSSVSDTFTLTVINTNVAPTLTRNMVLTVDAGTTRTIGDDILLAADPDNTASQVVYTLLSTPRHGDLLRAGAVLGAGDSFTQAEITDGRVVYVHDGSSVTSDSFLFDVSDGEGGSAGTSRFAISVRIGSVTPPPFDAGGGIAGGGGGNGSGSNGPVPGVDTTDSDVDRDTSGDSRSDAGQTPLAPPVDIAPTPAEAGDGAAVADDVIGTGMDATPTDRRADGGTTRPASMSLIGGERAGKTRSGGLATQEPSVEASPLTTGLGAALDSLKDQLQENLRDSNGGQNAATIAVASASLATSAGYLTWLLRGGSLFASVLASLPTWRALDPLPVLVRRRDEESRLVAAKRSRADDAEKDDPAWLLDEGVEE